MKWKKVRQKTGQVNNGDKRNSPESLWYYYLLFKALPHMHIGRGMCNC